MIYKLYSLDASNLLYRPETGMGYQVVLAKQYHKDTYREFVVYNSDLIVDLDNQFQNNKRRILEEGYQKTLNRSEEIMLETKTIIVLKKDNIVESRDSNYKFKAFMNDRHSGASGAIDNVVEYADGNEVFVRISAYENDKRIDFEKKKLLNGSYTTTLKDYEDCVSTNDDPIDRYALPNDEKIEWSFYIKPAKNDKLQRGVVQPAFNKDGGGIEAYFEKGTSNGSFLNKKEYGK